MPESGTPAAPYLDPAYVADAAEAIARYVIRRGRACEIAYTPGNGTLYELVIVPFDGLALDAAKDWMDHDKRRSITDDRPELVHEEGWALLAWVGHGAWPVHFKQVWHDSYICEKFADCTVRDAQAIRQLLLKAAEVGGLRTMTVVR